MVTSRSCKIFSSKKLPKSIRCNRASPVNSAPKKGQIITKTVPKKGQLIENSYVVKDDIEYTYSNVIPLSLWAFGLNY